MLSRHGGQHATTIIRHAQLHRVIAPASFPLPFLKRALHIQKRGVLLTWSGKCTRTFSTSRCLAAPKKSTGTSRPGRPRSTKSDAQPKKNSNTTTSKKASTTTRKRKTTKSKKKPAAKKTAKPRSKKAPSDHLVRYRKAQALKPVALLTTPKRLPETGYTLFITRNSSKGSGGTQMIKNLAANYRQLSTGDRQSLSEEAAENRKKNDRALRSWITSHSPEEIRLANEARRKLNALRKTPAGSPKQQAVTKPVQILRDDRRPRRPLSPYFTYSQERRNSGDFQGQSLTEMSKAIGKEWKAMSAQEKERRTQEYQPLYHAYEQERNAIYPGYTQKKKKSTKRPAQTEAHES